MTTRDVTPDYKRGVEAAPLSDAKLRVLRKVAAGHCFLRGAEVRVAKSMPHLVTLRDEGGAELRDGERWFALLTEDGERAAVAPTPDPAAVSDGEVVHLGRLGETSHACGASGGWANFAVLDAVTCVACLRAAVRAERAPDLYDPPAEQRDHDPLVHALATAKVTASDAARHLGAEVVRLRALACDATSKRADPVVLRLEQAAPDLSALRDAGAARGSSPRAERAPEAARPDVVTGAAAGHAGRLDGQHREEQNRRTR